MQFGILKFREFYKERIWGGDKLRRVLGKTIRLTSPVGEAWLIADHSSCESVVAEGEFSGKTLRALMSLDATSILGSHARPTPQGRFPLLLKLIDAGDVLSVQVHPDDEQAARLEEPDTGKTEMWFMLDTDRNSAIISGLREGVTREIFQEALTSGDVAPLMWSFPVAPDDGVFLAAGAVHAVGAGILLAEIQQNSDITYRLYDWNRMDKNGASRELHVEKALSVMDFDVSRSGRLVPLRYTENGVAREALAACSHFAAERLRVNNHADFAAKGKTFHIMLALDDVISLVAEDSGCVLGRGEAALVPASTTEWHIEGTGYVMDYYVPDLNTDIIAPLRRHGYDEAQIRTLGGLRCPCSFPN